MHKRILSGLLAGAMLGAGACALSACGNYEESFQKSNYDVVMSCTGLREGTPAELAAANPVIEITFTNNTERTIRYQKDVAIEADASYDFFLIGSDGTNDYYYEPIVYGEDEDDEEEDAAFWYTATFENGGTYCSGSFVNFPTLKAGESAVLRYELDLSDGWKILSSFNQMKASFNDSFSLGDDEGYLTYFSATEGNTSTNCSYRSITGTPSGYYSLYFYKDKTAYINFFHIEDGIAVAF